MSLPSSKNTGTFHRLLPEQDIEKLSKIICNFYIKAANLIALFRDSSHLPTESSYAASGKPNKWFNIITNNNPELSEELSTWRKVTDSSDVLSLPPLIIETFLDLRNLSSDQTLVIYKEKHNTDWRDNKDESDSDSDIAASDSNLSSDDDEFKETAIIVPKANKKSEIVLERWLIEFSMNEYDIEANDISVIYKQLVVLFRALDMLVQLLPSYKLLKYLNNDETRLRNLNTGTRILDGSKAIFSKGRIGLSKPVIPQDKNDKEMYSGASHISEKFLKPILTPIGAFKISVNYRNNCRFDLSYNDVTLLPQLCHNNSNLSSITNININMASNERKTTGTNKRLSLSNSSKSPTDSIKSTLNSPMQLPSSQQGYGNTQNSSQLQHQTPYNPIQLFKVGSINSSNSPPPQLGHSNSSQLMLSTNQSQPNVTSTNTTSQPIPMLAINNRSNSSASLVAVLRHNRGSINSINTDNRLITNSISPNDNFYHNSSNFHHPNSPITSGSGSVGSANTNLNTNTPHPKFSSSFGSKFKSSYGGIGSYSTNNTNAASNSRNNSIDGTIMNDIAINIANNTRRSSSIDSNLLDPSASSFDPTSMYINRYGASPLNASNFPIHIQSSQQNHRIDRSASEIGEDVIGVSAEQQDVDDDDNDIDQFVKMLESKPDLRFAGSTSPKSVDSFSKQDHLNLSGDPLSRFQLLRGSHDMLTDNINMKFSQIVSNHSFKANSLNSQSSAAGFGLDEHQQVPLGSSPASISLSRNQKINSISSTNQSKGLHGMANSSMINVRRSSSVSSNSSASSILNQPRRRPIANVSSQVASKSSSGTPIDIYNDPQLILRRNSDIRRRRSSANSMHNNNINHLSNSPGSQILLKNLSSSTTSTTNVTPMYAKLYASSSLQKPLTSSFIQERPSQEHLYEQAALGDSHGTHTNTTLTPTITNTTSNLKAMLLNNKSLTTSSSRRGSGSNNMYFDGNTCISSSVPTKNSSRKIDSELLELRTTFSNMNKLGKDQEEVIMDDDDGEEESMSERVSPNATNTRSLAALSNASQSSLVASPPIVEDSGTIATHYTTSDKRSSQLFAPKRLFSNSSITLQNASVPSQNVIDRHNNGHSLNNSNIQQHNHSSQIEDDEDELLFTMSDMTSVKNSHEF